MLKVREESFIFYFMPVSQITNICYCDHKVNNGLGNLSRSEFERNKFRNDPKHELRLEHAEVMCGKQGSIRYQFLKATKDGTFGDFTTMADGVMFVHPTGANEVSFLQQIVHESGGTWRSFSCALVQLGVRVAIVGGSKHDSLEDFSDENGIHLFDDVFRTELEMIPLPLNIFEGNSRGDRRLPFDEAQDIINNSGNVGVPPLDNRAGGYSFDNSRSKCWCRVVGCKNRNIKENGQLCGYHKKMLEYYDASNKMGWRIAAVDSDDDDNDMGDVEGNEENDNAEVEDEDEEEKDN